MGGGGGAIFEPKTLSMYFKKKKKKEVKKKKLEFLFMKHYAPNRFEPSIEALNFGGRGVDQGRCERRSDVL